MIYACRDFPGSCYGLILKGQETWLLNVRIKNMIIDEFLQPESWLHSFEEEGGRTDLVNKEKHRKGICIPS